MPRISPFNYYGNSRKEGVTLQCHAASMRDLAGISAGVVVDARGDSCRIMAAVTRVEPRMPIVVGSDLPCRTGNRLTRPERGSWGTVTDRSVAPEAPDS